MNRKTKPKAIAALIEDARVPVNVRHWLERYVSGDKYVYQHSDTEQLDSTMEIVRLVHAVLDDRAIVAGEGAPPAVRDLIEAYLENLEEETDIHLWNDADTAIAALPTMLDIINSSSSLGETIHMLKASVKALCTQREYEEFVDRHNLHSINSIERPRDEARERWVRDYAAAMKLSRYLASPHTPEATRERLEDAVTELSSNTQVTVCHPALVERAVSIIFESMQEKLTEGAAKTAYENLHLFLDALPEIPEGEARSEN